MTGTQPGAGSLGATRRIRTTNACRRCKKRKVKCSGNAPCRHCQLASQECIFDQADRRLVISQRHLRELQSRVIAYEKRTELSGEDIDLNDNRTPDGEEVADPEPSLRQAHSETPLLRTQREEPLVSPAPPEPPQALIQAQSPEPNSAQQDEIVNPLTATPSQFTIDPRGKQRYLGHSSTWSFSYQVRNLVREQVGEFHLHDDIPEVEGAAYGLHLALEQNDREQKIIGEIPSRDYVEHLVNTAYFHLGSTYHLFDKTAILQQLQTYRSERGVVDQAKNLSCVQLLLIIAFGRLFLGRQASQFGPPGAEFFVRAISMLPGITVLNRQPVLAIEVLCLIALYLQSADMRNDAFIYIGQALRIALSQGFNRNIDPTSMTPSQYSHRIKLWWSVYILDRKLSTLMGAPFSLNNGTDMDVPLPERPFLLEGQASETLSLNIKLSDLMGKIMASVYRLRGRLDKSFLADVQEALTVMTTLVDELNQNAQLHVTDSLESVSRTAATLHLAYHQCAMLATRPVLLHLVKKAFEPNNRTTLRVLSEPVEALLNTCVEAAKASLKILKSLHEQDLIELFLPFDSEATFSSAFVIIMASITNGNTSTSNSRLDSADSILHTMASRGNVGASCYEKELHELRDMAVSLRGLSNEHNNDREIDLQANQNLNVLDKSLGGHMFYTGNTLETQFGAMQSAVELLDSDFFDSADFNMLDDQWLWTQDSHPPPGQTYNPNITPE